MYFEDLNSNLTASFITPLGYESINEAKAYFGRSEVVFGIMVDLAAVVSRFVFVIFDVGISHSDGSFHAPTFFQYPLITVRDAGTVDFTVIPVVSQTEHI